jgi:hypothetical protein
MVDFNYQVFGVDPNKCFDSAFDRELPPGKYQPGRENISQFISPNTTPERKVGTRLI